MSSFLRINLKCFLTLESVRGTVQALLRVINKGSFFSLGIFFNMYLIAATGHKGDPESKGMLINFGDSGFCRVFVHLIRSVAPDGVKKTSADDSCLTGLNAAMECGTRFEILRKEKKAVRYTAL